MNQEIATEQQPQFKQIELSWDELKKQRRGWCNCATCRTKAYQTYWRPRRGMDARLRQYLCFIGHKTYVIRR